LSNDPPGRNLAVSFWSAAIHRRFPALPLNATQKESGDESPHSKTTSVSDLAREVHARQNGGVMTEGNDAKNLE
jgi:hypothetical protein